MKFTLVASALALATSVIAAPQTCITQAQANDIVSKYAQIQSHTGDVNATGKALFVKGYKEYSDSVATLQGTPLGGVTIAGRGNYLAAVASQPAITGIENLKVLVAGCTNVLWYFNFPNLGTDEVKGFGLFEINSALKITTGYVEFNSLAWAIDFNQLPCGVSTTSAVSTTATATPTGVTTTSPTTTGTSTDSYDPSKTSTKSKDTTCTTKTKTADPSAYTA